MKKKILKNFIMDHLFFTMVYFLSNFLIALFYYISIGNKIEIMYPACISLFVYTTFIAYRWVTYREFNMKVKKLAVNMNYDIKTYNREEKELVDLVFSIHQNYMEKISSIYLEDKSRKHLLSQWIHNMKTPISVIDLILQKTLKGEVPMKKALEDIKEENICLLEKLEQALNIMRFEDFTEDYIPEEVDLIAAIRQVINRRKNQFIYSKVYPKIDTDEETILVLSDRKWNEAMLDQIVSNAIKYSKSEEKAKTVHFSFKKEGDKVILSIRDEGIGIPDHDLGRVFNPFFTGDNGRAYVNASGIGLYFCSQVANRLGHDIKVKSKVGEGTEITITYLSKL